MEHRPPEAAARLQLSCCRRCVRPFGLLATLRKDEANALLLFFCYAFLLLLTYYILKTLREPLLLSGSSAELKSYAQGVVALVLLVLVPVYAATYRRIGRSKLTQWITLFFVCNLFVFYVLGRMGLDIAFAYYVWVGVFGVTILAQFWAHAADAFNTESGQRLFPAIMAGAALGGVVAPLLVGSLFTDYGAWTLMLVATALLAATLPLVAWTRNAVPTESRCPVAGREEGGDHLASGFALVLRERYLLLLASLVVLLNCINTTGEYILARVLTEYAEAELALDPAFDKDSLIASFYGRYFFAVNVLTLVAQLLIVPRLFRRIGVHGALLVLPMVAVVGYGLIAFVPVFGLLLLIKILENGADYSVMNTCRQALYLPLSAAAKYKGKIAIDGFFWRFGDVLQAGVVFVGLRWFGFGVPQFALLNVVLAMLCLIVAVELAQRYRRSAAPQPTVHGAHAHGALAAFAAAVRWLPQRRAALATALIAAACMLVLTAPAGVQAAVSVGSTNGGAYDVRQSETRRRHDSWRAPLSTQSVRRAIRS